MRWLTRATFVSAMTLAPLVAHAQTLGRDVDDSAMAVAFFVYLPAALMVVNLALMLWMYQDAKARDVYKPWTWVIATLFLGPIAWLFYLGSRPKGHLSQCKRCGEEKLQSAEVCPHCGFDAHRSMPFDTNLRHA